MDANGNIYRAPEDGIPEADAARLDGYLLGRAEEEELRRQRAEVSVEDVRQALERNAVDLGKEWGPTVAELLERSGGQPVPLDPPDQRKGER